MKVETPDTGPWAVLTLGLHHETGFSVGQSCLCFPKSWCVSCFCSKAAYQGPTKRTSTVSGAVEDLTGLTPCVRPSVRHCGQSASHTVVHQHLILWSTRRLILYVVYFMHRLVTAQTEVTAGDEEYMQLELSVLPCRYLQIVIRCLCPQNSLFPFPLSVD